VDLAHRTWLRGLRAGVPVSPRPGVGRGSGRLDRRPRDGASGV